MTGASFTLFAALITLGGASPAAAAVPPPDSVLFAATFDSVWVRIRDTYYDSTMRGLDWNAARRELRPRAVRAADVAELRRTLDDLLSRLGESHFVIIPAEAADALAELRGARDDAAAGGDVGIELRLMDERVTVLRVDTGGAAWAAGVRPGWELHSIDGRRTQDLVERVLAAAGEEGGKLALIQIPRLIEALLAGPPGVVTPRTVFIGPNGRRTALQLVRRPARGTPVTFGFLPPMIARVERERVTRGSQCAGVVRFSIWMAPVAAELDRAISDAARCRGVVLDLRGNPGGLAGMVMGVAGHFLPRPDSLGTLRMRTTTLHLVANPRTVDADGRRVPPPTAKLAIILDELSASTTEIFAAALQHSGRARVFGSRSPGFALPAHVTRLPNGDVLMHVVADLTLPDGTRIEGRGVVPDFEAPPSRAALLAGRDPALDAAVEWVFSPYQ